MLFIKNYTIVKRIEINYEVLPEILKKLILPLFRLKSALDKFFIN